MKKALKRIKLTRGKSRRIFRRGARVHRANRPKTMRGGYRL